MQLRSCAVHTGLRARSIGVSCAVHMGRLARTTSVVVRSIRGGLLEASVLAVRSTQGGYFILSDAEQNLLSSSCYHRSMFSFKSTSCHLFLFKNNRNFFKFPNLVLPL